MTCAPFEVLDKEFPKLFDISFSLIGPWLINLLAFGFMLVATIELIKGLTNRGMNVQMLVIKMTIFSIVGISLQGGAWLWWGTFEFLSNIGPYFAQLILEKVGSYHTDLSGIAGLLDAAEGSVFGKVSRAAVTLTRNVGITSKLSTWSGTVLLCIVYGILAYQMIRGVIKSYFVIVTNGMLLPFLIFFVAFDEFRVYAINAFRESVVAIFEFILGSAAIAVVLLLMDTVSQLKLMAAEDNLDAVVNVVEMGGDFFSVIGAGIMLILAHSVMMEQGGKIMLSFGQNAKGHFGSMIGTVMRAFGV